MPRGSHKRSLALDLKRRFNFTNTVCLLPLSSVEVRNTAFVPTVAKLTGASPKWAVERVAWWYLSPLGPSVC